MNRLLFIPLNRFSVDYTVATGRPFSELDRLVLRAIIESESPTVDQLRDMFQLPQRPLLENLVTLFHAGWIAMNSQGRFLPTEDGYRALRLGTLPVSMTLRTPRPVMILMEALTGMCVAARDGVHYESKQKLKDDGLWGSGRRLDAMLPRAIPDQGIVRSLLQTRRREWVHSIKDPVPRGQNAYFLRVLVEPDTGDILGLPEPWLPRLADILLEEARLARPLSPSIAIEQPKFEGGRFPDATRKITLHEDDLVTSAAEHQGLLHEALTNAAAQSWIVIAADAIDPTRLFHELGDAVRAALLRGVNIHLLWRTIERTAIDETGEAQLERVIAVLNEAATGRDGHGLLRANQRPARSRARFLFTVPPEPGTPEAWIGGWEWLTAAGGANASGVSVRLREPALLAELAHTTAALFESAAVGELSALPEIWRDLAERLDRLHFFSFAREDDDTAMGNCEVRLVRDREIDRSVAEAINRAGQIRIRTRSDDGDGPLLRRLRDRIRGAVVQATIGSPSASAEARERFGNVWSLCDANVAEAILADDTLIVSSAPMSGSSAENGSLADVGVAITGGPVVRKLSLLWSDETEPRPPA